MGQNLHYLSEEVTRLFSSDYARQRGVEKKKGDGKLSLV